MSDATKATILSTQHRVARAQIRTSFRLPVMPTGNYRSIPHSAGQTCPPGLFKEPSAEELPNAGSYTHAGDDRATALVDDPTTG